MLTMEGSLSPQKCYEVDKDVLYHTVGGEIVLLDLKSQQYYALDSIGARMWELLAEYGTAGTVADRMCSEYDADRTEVLRDVESMLQDFCVAGLVRERSHKQ